MSRPEPPLVSVVMPSLDQARYLPRALHSVLGQRGDFRLECIVVDGGSTDDSVRILESFGDAVRWTSGPDGGQSQALNEGFASACGEIHGWLNSDDLYAPGALQRVVDVFRREPETRWLYGKVAIVDEDDRVVRRGITAYKNLRMRRFSYRSLLTENWVSQMGVFWRRDAWDEVGSLREDLHYAMDYDLWLRLGRRWPGRFVDSYLAAFRWHPEAKTSVGYRESRQEGLRVAHAHAGGAYPLAILQHRFNTARTAVSYSLLRALRR